MSITHIPETVKIRLWGKAAGCCQYRGCQQPLYLDSLTKAEFNTAYIAHIIADSPGGPRGDPILSEQLKDNISNLMLMCDVHHRLIDKQDVFGHPVNFLRQMKKEYEEKIGILSSIKEEFRSHVLTYGANIGNHAAMVSIEKTYPAITPHWYPAEKFPIELSLKNSWFVDSEPQYWFIERENLRRQFSTTLKPRLISGEIKHLSVFAFAPQPLLIELGHLLSDIPTAKIYQLHREPPNWVWQKNADDFHFEIIEPMQTFPVVALNLSLSANIDDSRIQSVLGPDVSIWTVKTPQPNNDFLKTEKQLQLFREQFRLLLDRIKHKHGQSTVLHVFPAVPVAIAVEIGRVRMPKSDLPLKIYDQSNAQGGFIKAFEISVSGDHHV